MVKKRRSDIAKLVSKSREIWRQSQNYQSVKKVCKIVGKSGWFKCQTCHSEVEVIKIDHIKPIGEQPVVMHNFGEWLEKLFCEPLNLQGLCTRCHSIKTKEENKLRRCKHKNTWFDRTISTDLGGTISGMHTVCSDCGKNLY